MNPKVFDYLRLITPIMTALTFFIITTISSNINSLSKELGELRSEVSATNIKMENRVTRLETIVLKGGIYD